jgi:peptidoglycan/LPS O-acetylase OafA/YrhL
MAAGLFFVLSGFLVGYLYIQQNIRRGATEYIAHMVARIAPLHFSIVFASILVEVPQPFTNRSPGRLCTMPRVPSPARTASRT